MRQEGLGRPKVWHRPARPKSVERMTPSGPCQYWQVDMTSFQLSCLTTLFLVVVIDCFFRRIVAGRCQANVELLNGQWLCEWDWSRKVSSRRSCVLGLLSDRTTEPSRARRNSWSSWARMVSRVNTSGMMPQMRCLC